MENINKNLSARQEKIEKKIYVDGLVNIQKLIALNNYDIYKEYIEKECCHYETYLKLISNKDYEKAYNLIQSMSKWNIKAFTILVKNRYKPYTHIVNAVEIIDEIETNKKYKNLEGLDLSFYFIHNIGGGNEDRMGSEIHGVHGWLFKRIYSPYDGWKMTDHIAKLDINEKRKLFFEDVINLNDIRFFKQYLKYQDDRTELVRNMCAIFENRKYMHRKDCIKLLVEHGIDIPPQYVKRLEDEYKRREETELRNKVIDDFLNN